MSVATIYQNQNKPKSYYKLLYVLIFVGLLAVVYFGIGFTKSYLALGGNTALTADVFFGEGGVYLDGELLGPFPYTSKDIKSGEHKVTFKGNGRDYDDTINFLPNSEVIMKRDLGSSMVFSAGQNFWLSKGDSGVVLSVISEPNGSDIYIDNTKVGSTPYSSSDLSSGDYDIRVQKVGYEPQSARINISKDHKLNASFSMFPIPVPTTVSLLEDSNDLYDVYSDNPVVTGDPAAWVDAIIYWNKTRGVNLEGAGLNKDPVFDYFLDYNGSIYTSNGTKVALDSATFVENAKRGAYLRRISDGPGLSEAARTSFLALGGRSSGGKKATVLETGVGWLRVRDEPGLDGNELTRVNVGDVFDVLEEQGEWVKIKISDAVEGWVSTTYVSIEEAGSATSASENTAESTAQTLE